MGVFCFYKKARQGSGENKKERRLKILRLLIYKYNLYIYFFGLFESLSSNCIRQKQPSKERVCESCERRLCLFGGREGG